MSNAKKCDRCGNYYEPYKDHEEVVDRRRGFVAHYDFCPKCDRELRLWLNTYRQITPMNPEVE